MNGATSKRAPLMLAAMTLVTLAGLGVRAPHAEVFGAAAAGVTITTLALYAALLPLYEHALTRGLVLLVAAVAHAFWLTVVRTLTLGEAAVFAGLGVLFACGLALLSRRAVRP